MFQFRRFPAYAYLIQRTLLEYCSSGFPHSEIPGSMDICSSPRLIAACHVLRRLLMPRHSPCALSSLTCSSQSPLGSASADSLPAFVESFTRSLPPRFSPKTGFRRMGDGSYGLVPSCQRILVLFENYAGLQRSKLYVTLHPFGCCSTINLLRCMSPYNASLLPYLLCHIVQFSRCRSPTAFAVRFEDPIFRSGLQIQRQIAWWARVGSNHRPYDYQSYALAS